MNSKLVKASLAGAAAIALAAGGGTYAGWSDFSSQSLTTTDGYLRRTFTTTVALQNRLP